MRFIDEPHLDPSSRNLYWHVLLYSLGVSQCTPVQVPHASIPPRCFCSLLSSR